MLQLARGDGEDIPTELESIDEAPAIAYDSIRKLKPEGLTVREPTLRAMTKYIMVYIASEGSVPLKELALRAGLKPGRVYSWATKYPHFGLWKSCCVLAACQSSLGDVWKSIIANARSGSPKAQEMYLKRFDDIYTARVGKLGHIPSPIVDPVDPAQLERARLVLGEPTKTVEAPRGGEDGPRV